MKIEIKNLLYQPMPIMFNDGRVVNIKARSKKVLKEDLLVAKQIETLKNKEQIKVKNI